MSNPVTFEELVDALRPKTAEEIEAFRRDLEQFADMLARSLNRVTVTAAQAARFFSGLDAMDKEATSYFRYQRVQRRIVERGPRRRKHDGRWAKLRRR